ncbi:MAG: C-GCAxxG-C-C family protein [Fidelibacterota bacterium]
MNRIDKAITLKNKNYNCAQVVFAAYADLFDIPEKAALQIAAGFGAGIGHTENICGAISGAIMLIGLKNYKNFGSLEAKEKIYQLSAEFVEAFEDVHESDNCEVLLDLKEKKGIECREYIKTACELFEVLYLDIENKDLI